MASLPGLNGTVTRWVVYSCLIMALTTHSPSSLAEPLSSLDPLRWERRVILVFANDSTFTEVQAALGAAQASLAERDVTWLLIGGDDTVDSNHTGTISRAFVSELKDGFAPLSEPVDVVLVGKDGGVKARAEALDLPALFDQIDGMPMRQRELRERATPPPGGGP